MKNQQSKQKLNLKKISKNILNLNINNKDTWPILAYRRFFIADFENGLQNKQYVDGK